ncbi:MAG: pyruvate ferredoxin oxidoreductase subunit gamma/delta [bacterium]|nr:MAG: pyruvate ferredoxin oxidoreductase subunit gamma/delta [bacterium]
MQKLPIVSKNGFYEIRMASIGGFGANLAGKILGEAGILKMGYNGSNFSSYGSEKKGSPISAFVRFCDPSVTVRVNAPVTDPHMLVIFLESIAKSPGMLTGVSEETTVIINTAMDVDEARDYMGLACGTLVVVDAMKIAVEEKTRVNTALLGTMAAASGFLSSDAVKETISDALGKKYASMIPANLKTFDRGAVEFKKKKFSFDKKYPKVVVNRHGQKLGYLNQPMGGVIPAAGTSMYKDLTASRMGYIPVLNTSKCTSCGECDITCPDYCFEWGEEANKKGKLQQVLKGIVYQYCKGCLRCVRICKFEALTEHVEYEVNSDVIKKGHVDDLKEIQQ